MSDYNVYTHAVDNSIRNTNVVLQPFFIDDETMIVPFNFNSSLGQYEEALF